MGIPIVIGVTGYLSLRARDEDALRALVRGELERLAARYGHSELVMLSSVAVGADTLCAKVALDMGLKLVCPLPMPIDEYRKDFSDVDAAVFDDLLRRASSVFVAPDTEPKPDEITRDYHYRQAGIYVAAHSHALLALWDGSPGKPDGCGAAEAVQFMLDGDYGNGESCLSAANDGVVIQIRAQRAASQAPDAPAVRLIEKRPGSLAESLAATDAFNEDEQALPGGAEDALLPDEIMRGADEGLKNLHALYCAADRLSLLHQKRTMRAIKCFSIFGVLLVTFFLLYDELSCNLFLPCYGAVMLVYLLLSVRVGRGKHHEKYLQYRMLSEALRAQFYVSAAGARENVGRAFTWTQRQETAWIREAVSALLIGAPTKKPIPAEAVKSAWIDGQLTYHQNALKRNKKKLRANDSAAKWMLIASVALFLAVLSLEFFFGDAMERAIFAGTRPAFLLPYSAETLTVRSLMKILLGGLSAITVFLTNYYGKLSLERKCGDHEKMAALYAQAKARFERGQTPHGKLFAELAREEIIENANWFSYCRENAPSFNL